jgi:hypothetical protein
MTTYNHTIPGGGTVGHPGNVPRPYMVQSRIFDAADQNLSANDVVQMIDVPDNTMVIGGCIDVLEAGGSGLTYDVGLSTDIDAFADGVDGNADAIYQFNLKAAGINTVTAADAIQVKALGAGVTAGRFRVIAILCDIGTGPKQTASVTTGT